MWLLVNDGNCRLMCVVCVMCVVSGGSFLLLLIVSVVVLCCCVLFVCLVGVSSWMCVDGFEVLCFMLVFFDDVWCLWWF